MLNFAFDLMSLHGDCKSMLCVCMYVWSSQYSKIKEQPGKVANPARGQLNRENEYSPVLIYLRLRIWSREAGSFGSSPVPRQPA